MQPRLEQKMGFLPSTILTAFIWFAWHLPLFFITGTAQNSNNPLSFILSCLSITFATVAIRHISKGAWLYILFHCVTNALQGSLPLVEDYRINLVTSAVLIAASLVVVWINSRKQPSKASA